MNMSSFRILVVLAAMLSSGAVWAEVVTLQNDNSLLKIDPVSSLGGFSWTVDGKEVLSKHWFWYRVGSSGAEASIDTIGTPVVTLTDGSGDALNDRAVLRYTQTTSTFELSVDQTLNGGAVGSDTADLSVKVRIINLTNQPLEFHLFEYCNMNLSLSDTLSISGNTINQIGGAAHVMQSSGMLPSHYEAGLNGSILASLTDASATTLADAPGAFGGDVEWGLQWDATIDAGSTLLIGKDLHVAPEPATLALLVMGGLALLKRRT